MLQTAECIDVTAGGPLGCIWLVEHRLKGVGVCKKNVYYVQKIW